MDYRTKTAIGFSYVLDLLSPVSGPGKEKLKHLALYPIMRHTALETELDNVAAALKHMQNGKEIGNLKLALSGVKDLCGTFKRLSSGETLTEVELCEIKIFGGSCKKLAAMCDTVDGIRDVEFVCLKEVTGLLSLSGAGGFFIGDEYSDALKDIRLRKKEVSILMKNAKTSVDKEKHTRRHLEISAEEQREEALVREELSKQLLPWAVFLLKNLEAAAAIDLIISKAELANKYGAVRPVVYRTSEAGISGRLRLAGVRNPMTEQVLNAEGRTFKPFTVEAVRGVTVITGANMGGKTVALKTVALNVALALSGFFVFADYAEVPHAGFIEFVSAETQSGGRNLSAFAAETVKINAVFKALDKMPGFVLIDEFAAGTNAEEGAVIFRSAVKAFGKQNGITLMTTHFDGAGVYAGAHYQVTGLRNAPLDIIRTSIKAAPQTGPALLAEHMDYGLVKIPLSAAAPKDAVTICRLLDLDPRLLSLLEE